MKKIYTCFVCGSAWDLEEEDAVKVCPYCAAPEDKLFVEPFIDDFQNRRIHVDPVQPDPNWDKYDIRFHHPRQFPSRSRHGQIRRFVTPYDDAELAKKFYGEIFNWDIIPAIADADESDPLMLCATGPGWNNWEPMFPSFTYGYLKSRASDTTGANPRLIIEVNNVDDICARVPEYGGKVLKEKYINEEGHTYAVLQDSEGTPFYVMQTPEGIDWNCPENQNNFDVREYPQMYREGCKNQGPVPTYPGRAPKVFPEKDLHGRARFASLGYKDFKRFQKFWVDLFGWDMIELPESAGGKPVGDPHPTLLIATGPSYYDYEGLVPGHMNAMAHYCEGELDKVSIMMEIHMYENSINTARKVQETGGKLLNEIPEKDTWSSMVLIEDPFGSGWSLWKCPPTRTWTDPESGYQGMSEEHIDRLSLFWKPKAY